MNRARERWRVSLSELMPEPVVVTIWLSVLLVEAVALVAYAQLANARLMLFHVYPFVWINLGVWVMWRTSTPDAPIGTRRVAGVLAGGYFLVLAYFGGLLREGHAFHDHGETPPAQLASGFDVIAGLPPGYGPALTYSGEYVVSTVAPYMLIGFLALTYLLYVTILDASGGASIGLVGLFSCVGCSFPLIATLVSGGATTTVAALVYSQAYPLSTAVFAATLLALYWRPFGAVRTLWSSRR